MHNINVLSVENVKSIVQVYMLFYDNFVCDKICAIVWFVYNITVE